MLTAMGVDRRVRRSTMVPPALLAQGPPRPLRVATTSRSRSRDRLPAFFATARSRGLTTSFDTNWDPTERWDGGSWRCSERRTSSSRTRPRRRRIARRRRSGTAARGTRRGRRRGRTRRRAGRRRQAQVLGASAARAGERALVRVAAMPVDAGRHDRGRRLVQRRASCGRWLDGGVSASASSSGPSCGAMSTLADRRGRRPADASPRPPTRWPSGELPAARAG